MRTIARILLVYWMLGSIFPQGDFSQFASIPTFFQHYRLHKSESTSPLSFWDFWTQHYGDNFAHQHDDGSQSHQHLPLKNLQDFQWVTTRCQEAVSAGDARHAIHMPYFLSLLLPEGIRASVFRPPLVA